MEIIAFLLLCHLFITNGKNRLNGSEREKNPTPGEAIISRPHWQPKNKGSEIDLNCKSANNSCSKHPHPLCISDHHLCNLKSICASKIVNMTVWVPLSIYKNNSTDFQKCPDYLKCPSANGKVAPANTKASVDSTKRKHNNQHVNRSTSVTSSYTIQKLDIKKWMQIQCPLKYLKPSAKKHVFIQLFTQCPFNISIQGCPHSAKAAKSMRHNGCVVSFKDNEDMKNITFNITGVVNKINLHCLKENDTLPRDTELTENQLKFKGPMKENYNGMYLCVASYHHCEIQILWEMNIASDEYQWSSRNIVLTTLCLVFLASASAYYIFRWRRRKQLVVIPQQYSIHNTGYQNPTIDIDDVKAPHNCREGVSSVDQPQDSRGDTNFTKTTLNSKAAASSCNVTQTENVNSLEVSQQTTDYHKFCTHSGT